MELCCWCITVLISCHPRLSLGVVAARAGGLLLPGSGGCASDSITQEVLSRRTNDYQGWVEAYACNQDIPMEWAESEVRKKDYLQLPLRRLQNRNQHGVYFILKS